AAVAASRRSRTALIPANQSDFVNLIISCVQIAGHDQRAAGVPFAIDAEYRSGKFVKQCGAAGTRGGAWGDLQEIGRGPVIASGFEFPVARVAGRGEHGCCAPFGFFCSAAGFGARCPGEFAELSGEKHFGGGALVREFAAWIARGVETRGGEGDGLFDGAGGVEAKSDEILVAVEEDGEATLGGVSECGGVQDSVGSFVHKLARDAHGSDGKRGGGESRARYGNDAHIVAIANAGACSEHQLGGGLDRAHFQEGSAGLFGDGQVMLFESLAQGVLPRGIGGEIRVGVKLQAKGAVKTGNGGDAVRELTRGIIKRIGIGGHDWRQGNKTKKEQREKEAKRAKARVLGSWE